MRIAISGFSGSGKTTLAKKLFHSLREKGIDIELINPSFKDIAKRMGITLMELQKRAEKDEKIDIEFDNEIKERFSKAENSIVASWLAIWLVEADLKVFLFSPLKERAKRISLRDSMSYEEALKHVTTRDKQNVDRYKRLYNIDITRFNEEAHIVMNSSLLSVEEELNIILCYLNKKKQ